MSTKTQDNLFVGIVTLLPVAVSLYLIAYHTYNIPFSDHFGALEIYDGGSLQAALQKQWDHLNIIPKLLSYLLASINLWSFQWSLLISLACSLLIAYLAFFHVSSRAETIIYKTWVATYIVMCLQLIHQPIFLSVPILTLAFFGMLRLSTSSTPHIRTTIGTCLLCSIATLSFAHGVFTWLVAAVVSYLANKNWKTTSLFALGFATSIWLYYNISYTGISRLESVGTLGIPGLLAQYIHLFGRSILFVKPNPLTFLIGIVVLLTALRILIVLVNKHHQNIRLSTTELCIMGCIIFGLLGGLMNTAGRPGYYYLRYVQIAFPVIIGVVLFLLLQTKRAKYAVLIALCVHIACQWYGLTRIATSWAVTNERRNMAYHCLRAEDLPSSRYCAYKIVSWNPKAVLKRYNILVKQGYVQPIDITTFAIEETNQAYIGQQKSQRLKNGYTKLHGWLQHTDCKPIEHVLLTHNNTPVAYSGTSEKILQRGGNCAQAYQWQTGLPADTKIPMQGLEVWILEEGTQTRHRADLQKISSNEEEE